LAPRNPAEHRLTPVKVIHFKLNNDNFTPKYTAWQSLSIVKMGHARRCILDDFLICSWLLSFEIIKKLPPDKILQELERFDSAN
jgi:hypothetical protein